MAMAARLEELWGQHAAQHPRKRPSIRAAKSESDHGHIALVTVSENLPGGRGLALTRDVEPAELLLTIPPSMLINIKSMAVLFQDAARCQVLPSHRIAVNTANMAADTVDSSSKLPLTSVQALSLLLFCVTACFDVRQAGADINGSSNEAQRIALNCFLIFAASLPHGFGSHPLIWHMQSIDNSVNEALRRRSRILLGALPTEAKERVEKAARKMTNDLDAVSAVLLERPHLLPDFARSKAVSLLPPAPLAFSHIWLSINTRSVFYPLGLPSHEDNVTLVPLLDMANHSSNSSKICSVSVTSQNGLQSYGAQRSLAHIHSLAPKPDAGTIEMRAPNTGDQCEIKSHLKRGHEVYIQYGARDDCALLGEYGFHLSKGADESLGQPWQGNPYAALSLYEPMTRYLERLPPKQRSGKEEVLRNSGYWTDWTVHPTAGGTEGLPSFRTEMACRLLAIDSRVERFSAESGDLDFQDKGDRHRKRRCHNDIDGATRELPAESHQEHDLRRFYLVASGRMPRISAANEAAARQLLSQFCYKAIRGLEAKRGRLQQQWPHTVDSGSRFAADDWQDSFQLVDSLLTSQIAIAQRVINAGT